jgi:hypothetical protein
MFIHSPTTLQSKTILHLLPIVYHTHTVILTNSSNSAHSNTVDGSNHKHYAKALVD